MWLNVAFLKSICFAVVAFIAVVHVLRILPLGKFYIDEDFDDNDNNNFYNKNNYYYHYFHHYYC